MNRMIAAGAALAASILGIVLFSAVGEADTETRAPISKPTSVAAYAAKICPMETVADRGMTWGAVNTKSTNAWKNKWSRVVPPESVETWHDVQEATVRLYIDVAKDKDANSLYNPLDFWLDDDNFDILLAWNEEANGGLPASDRATLRSAGCVVVAPAVQQQPPTPTTTPTPTPAATPAPAPEAISLSGTGTSTETFSLPAGQWIVEVSVTGNEDCSYGSCRETNFIVWIKSVAGESYHRELVANEIDDEWRGSKSVKVGGSARSYSYDLEPGRQILEVDAAGSWTVSIQPV